jgi:hypothetical protein
MYSSAGRKPALKFAFVKRKWEMERGVRVGFTPARKIRPVEMEGWGKLLLKSPAVSPCLSSFLSAALVPKQVRIRQSKEATLMLLKTLSSGLIPSKAPGL